MSDIRKQRRAWVKAVGGGSFKEACEYVDNQLGVAEGRTEQWCISGFPARRYIALRDLGISSGFPFNEMFVNWADPTPTACDGSEARAS